MKDKYKLTYWTISKYQPKNYAFYQMDTHHMYFKANNNKEAVQRCLNYLQTKIKQHGVRAFYCSPNVAKPQKVGSLVGFLEKQRPAFKNEYTVYVVQYKIGSNDRLLIR